MLLVTHALHFLPAVDRVYTLERGRLNEAGETEADSRVQDQGIANDQITLAGEPCSSAASISDLGAECGRIAEQGTYEELLRAGESFARLVDEFGNAEGRQNQAENETKTKTKIDEGEESKPEYVAKAKANVTGTGKLEGKLMRAEKRKTGSVEWAGKRIYSSWVGKR